MCESESPRLPKTESQQYMEAWHEAKVRRTQFIEAYTSKVTASPDELPRYAGHAKYYFEKLESEEKRVDTLAPAHYAAQAETMIIHAELTGEEQVCFMGISLVRQLEAIGDTE